MFAQAILDLLIIAIIGYFLLKVGKDILGHHTESAATLRIKLTELKAMKQRLEEMEKEVDATKTLMEIKQRLEKCNERIKTYEDQIKRKEG